MTVISVMALKGGVGKTSVTLGLAGAATVRGMAVLVVDLDPQGNATAILAAQEPTSTAADVLSSPSRAHLIDALTPCSWEIPPGEVDVLASDSDLIRHDAWTGGRWSPHLAKALANLDGYDLVLIDCPPSFGALTREALAASDSAVIVTTPSYFGSEGVAKAITLIDEVRVAHNRALTFAGVIVNRVRSTAEEHDYRLQEITDLHGKRAVLQPPIPERIAIQQAEGMGVPVQKVSTAGGREVAGIFDTHLRRLMR